MTNSLRVKVPHEATISLYKPIIYIYALNTSHSRQLKFHTLNRYEQGAQPG